MFQSDVLASNSVLVSLLLTCLCWVHECIWCIT